MKLLSECTTNTADLVEIRGDTETGIAAATYVKDHVFTPFGAPHLVESDGETIVSSDGTYEGFAPRLDPTSSRDE